MLVIFIFVLMMSLRYLVYLFVPVIMKMQCFPYTGIDSFSYEDTFKVERLR